MDDYSFDGYDYSFYIDVSFFRVNNYKVIRGEKYELTSYDESVHTGVYTIEENSGYYHLLTREYTDSVHGFTYYITMEMLVNLIPPAILNELIGIETVADLEKFEEYENIINYHVSATNDIYFSLYIPVKLKNVKAVNGFRRQDIILLVNYEFRYKYDGNGNIVYKRTDISLISDVSKAMYDIDIKPINSIGDLAYYTPEEIGKACLNTDQYGMIIMDNSLCTESVSFPSSSYNLALFFEAQEGEVVFQVENTVNGLVKYNASENKDLNYKIFVTNIGNASSGENVITTYIPEELEVIKNQISDDGIYNEEEHIITWNIDRIDIDETVELSYKAIAPDDVNGKELIGKSSIDSNYVLGAVYSNNTIVTLDRIVEVIKNPETGTMVYIANTNIGLPLSMLIILLVVFVFMILVFVKKFKKVD